MSRAHLGIPGIVLLALLAFPRAASADFIDWIWEMSGPQMIGGVSDCVYGPQSKKVQCHVFDKTVSGPVDPRSERSWWLIFEGAAYVSTGVGPHSSQFKTGQVKMLAFEPMLEGRVPPRGDNFWVQGGVGISYDYLFGNSLGNNFSSFTKAGVKLRGSFRIDKVELSVTGRFYPHRFKAEQFGVLPGPVKHEYEWLKGLSFGYHF